MRLLNVGVLLLVILLSTGCGFLTPSAESEFYLLSSSPLQNQPLDIGKSELVTVGPITMADYLKRVSIVKKSSEHEYDVSKLEEWAGNLESEFQIALLKNLSALDQSRIYFRSPGLVNLSNPYSIRADILRFDVQPGGVARLEVSWGVIAKGNTVIAGGNYEETMPAGDGYEAAASAMSQLVSNFSKEINRSFPARAR